MSFKTSELLSSNENVLVINLLGNKCEIYVIALVKSFHMKPAVDFAEAERVVLCVTLDVDLKRFYLQLVSIPKKIIAWKHEITELLKVKIKTNKIAIDGRHIGSIRVEFESLTEAADVYKNINDIIEIKAREMKNSIDHVKNANKKKNGKKIFSLDDISAPIGFRHMNKKQMAIVERLPEHFRNNKEGIKIIEEFFKHNDVSAIVDFDSDDSPKKTRPLNLPPARPNRLPPAHSEQARQGPALTNFVAHPLHNKPPPLPKNPPSLNKSPRQGSQKSMTSIPVAPVPPPMPTMSGPPPPPPPGFLLAPPSQPLVITKSEAPAEPPASFDFSSIGNALKTVQLKKVSHEVQESRSVDTRDDLLRQIKEGTKLKSKDEWAQRKPLVKQPTLDSFADDLMSVLKTRLEAFQPDPEDTPEPVRMSFFEDLS